MAEIEKNGRKVQIIGTHMQAGGTKELKKSQYAQMACLGKECSKDGELQLYCGDFNTHKQDTTLYPYLVDQLAAKDGDITGELQYTTDHLLNDFGKPNPTKRSVIDYIFVKENGVTPVSITRKVCRPQHQWDATRKDLSDHFGVIMQIVY